MESETKFIKGIYVEDPNPKAPEFVKAKLSIKCDELVIDLRKWVNRAGYVNLDLCRSKGGKLYLKVNDFEPKSEKKEDIAPNTDGQPW